MTTPTLAQPVLKPGRLYLAYDRLVCATPQCAGSSALFTGRTTGGARVTPINAQDRAEWAAWANGAPMTCECGAVTDGPPPAPAPAPSSREERAVVAHLSEVGLIAQEVTPTPAPAPAPPALFDL